VTCNIFYIVGHNTITLLKRPTNVANFSPPSINPVRAAMSDHSITVETDGPVCTIIINRPDKRNAIDRVNADALRDAFEQFEHNTALKAAVLWGAGGIFCAGADLSALADPNRRNEVDNDQRGPMGPTRMALKKPVIAAVSGYAVAGGLELALFCDMRIAEQSSTFGVFCRRWGVPLIDGGTVRLPRIVGQGRALDMILTGRPVKADEALSIGLANRVVPDGQARTSAEELAHQLAKFPQKCMLADRQSVYQQWDQDLTSALITEGKNANPQVLNEAHQGAALFTQGAGRHGSFE
jgi:enoyl-CoA hydratase/carnithine racemase